MGLSTKNEADKRKEIQTLLNQNMFVEAGAGAGKTTLIVNRIANQLKSKTIEPKNIVVITFTNKAAEELRQRITEKIQEEKLDDILEHIDEMNISTIHSFCNVLIKEQALLAGVPQNITLVDEAENERIKEDFFNDYIRKNFTQAKWQGIMQFAPGSKIKYIKEDIYTIFSTLCELPDKTVIKMPKNVSSIPQDLDKYFRDYFDASKKDSVQVKLLSVANSCIADKQPQYANLSELKDDKYIISTKLGELIEAILASPFDLDNAIYKLFSAGKGIFKKPSAKTRYAVDADGKLSTQNEDWNKYWDKIFSCLVDFAGARGDSTFIEKITSERIKESLYQGIVNVAKDIRDDFWLNGPKDKISNDRLLHLTEKLICSDTDASRAACEYFANKYSCYYVDEFQDTDNVQANFIYRLASDLSDPSHENLRDGALFVVGDPKQSIYRFRGAEPEIYFKIKEKFSSNTANGTVYELEDNYRTNKELINWINTKFAAADGVGNINITSNAPYKAMNGVKEIDANPKDPQKLIHGIYHYNHADSIVPGKVEIEKKTKDGEIIEQKDGYVYSSSKREDDINAVIQLILTLTDKNNGYTVTDYEYTDGIIIPKERAIVPGDFLLLTRKTPNMHKYLTALQSYGIPVLFDGKLSLKDDLLLATYVRIYKNLVNPREPFFRMAAKEAIRNSRIMLKDDSSNITEEEFDKLCDDLLLCLYDDCRKMSPFGKAEYLEKQITVLFSKNEDLGKLFIKEEQTRLRQMLEYIFSSSAETGLEVAALMENYLASKVEHELSLEYTSKAVRFMNLHKSKGLEGTIVVLMDREARKAIATTKYRSGNGYYPGLMGYRGKAKWFAAAGISTIVEANNKEINDEEFRLEYVAVTRAKQAFIFMDVIRNPDATNKYPAIFDRAKIKGKTAIDPNTYNFEIDSSKSIKDIIDNSNYSKNTPNPSGNFDVASEEYAIYKADANDARSISSYEKQSPSGLELDIKNDKYAVAKLGKASGLSAVNQKSSVLVRPVGNIVGNILHRTMELVVSKYHNSIVDGLKYDDVKEEIITTSAEQATNEFETDIIKDKQNGYDVLNIAKDPEEDRILSIAITDRTEEDKKKLSEIIERKQKEKIECYKKFVTACANSYLEFLKTNEYLDNIEDIFTEVPFAEYEENVALERKNKAGETEIENKNIWMSGTADLILSYKDGKVILIDYKSDNDFYINDKDMNELVTKKYTPQLRAYKNMIENVFNAKPEIMLISFSQKDETGKLYDDDSVRVRKTVVNID